MVLTPEEYDTFLEVHLELLYYAGTKYHFLNTGTSLQDFKDLPLADKFECRKHLNENPDILEDYINRNQAKLSSGQIQILDGFSRSVMSRNRRNMQAIILLS